LKWERLTESISRVPCTAPSSTSKNGQAISGPVPPDFGGEIPPPVFGEYLQNVGMLMTHVRTESIRTYVTKLEGGWVLVAL